MPQAPNVDGLPVWLQVVVSLVFVFATAAMAYRGLQKRTEREPQGAAQTVLASIPDMGAVRHLADVCVRLIHAVEGLETCIAELTHHERNHIEAERELCARLREVRERMDRLPPR